MSSFSITDLHQEALSRLEQEELSLLNWGAVDGSFSIKEAEKVISLVPGAKGQESQILQDLIAAVLVVRAGNSIPKRYRTRFADTVRLLLKLRQLQRGKSWRDGRHLIADARILHRPRQFPRRFVSADDLAVRLETEGHDLPLIDKVRCLVDGRQLADFQSEATIRILRSLETAQNAGFVISAATSGGKSLAFYLPAMAWISQNSKENDPWVKALALYPRQELLKDQMTSAFASARILDGEQRKQNKPLVSVGAYYGETPYDNKAVSNPRLQFAKPWRVTRTGSVCPFMRCPRCEGDMEWLNRDIGANNEILHCRTEDCLYVTPNGSLRLTRNSMKDSPPDILLTTTEMLNRNLSTKPDWKLFGVKTRPPRMMLLDEIHTNEGISGAQTALLIRRWRHLARVQPCTFVGLSATLADPQHFFSELTGLYENQVMSIEPDPTNIVSKGTEYMLALRSDPTTGVSTLSTTIQTLMLLRRMLDNSSNPSQGVMGQRIFAFTDKLDVLNRLYDDFGDSEGWDRFKRPNKNYQIKTLASLRRPDPSMSEYGSRDTDGQIWSTAQQLGHNLMADASLTVGRTASNDPGVDTSDVIIATASLEVGYNDPTVGAVVQHKAPRGAAAFLQRKGRAGRSESMRPYSVVVLSDFGRDRIAYLSYERLFSPELDPINLPIRNRYVLRMQATYSTMDWLAHQVIQDHNQYPSAWNLFSEKSTYDSPVQRRALKLITEVLNNGQARIHLRRHLELSLNIDATEVEALLWNAPRSLLLHVLPTLHRLLTSWLTNGIKEVPQRKGKPLPEFVPQAMFSELLLPEVEMRIPAATTRNSAREENLGVAQALRDFAPGKFNRRYGFTHGTESHWIPVEPINRVAVVDLSAGTYEGEWLPDVIERNDDGTSDLIRVLRPTAIQLVSAPKSLSASSTAFPKWRAAINFENPHILELVPSPWVHMLVQGLEVYCHSLGGTLQICRYIPNCDGRLVTDKGDETLYSTVFTDKNDNKAALGFMLDVDGLRVLLHPQDHLHLQTSGVLPTLLASWLSELFENVNGIDDINSFGRQNLLLVALGAIAKVNQAPNLQAAWNFVVADPELDLLRQAARDIADNSSVTTSTELLTTLLDLLKEPTVLTALGSCIARTVQSDPDFDEFLSRRYVATMAGAFVQAMMGLVPSMTSDDVAVDVLTVQHDGNSFGFWLSETEAGSSGIIEAFINGYQKDPQLFWRLFERALDPPDLELSDERLAKALDLSANHTAVQSAWLEVRTSMHIGVNEYRTALGCLFDLLHEQGVEVDHLVRTTLASRILSAGSSTAHDNIRTQLRNDWLALELHYNIEFDMRSFACRWAGNPVYDSVIGNGIINPCDRHSFFSNLMWLRGGQVRELQFEIPQPFGGIDKPDRLLVPPPPRMAIHFSAGRSFVDSAILTDGEAIVWADVSEKRQLANLLRDFAVQPTVAQFMNVYPRVTSIMLRGGEIHCHVELVEVAS